MERSYCYVLKQDEELAPAEYETTASRNRYEAALHETVHTGMQHAITDLDSKQGFKCLVDVGNRAVSHWKKGEGLYRDFLTPGDRMTHWANEFLDDLYKTFVDIRLTNKTGRIARFKMGNSDAYTGGQVDWEDWHPKDVGTLELNRDVSIPSTPSPALAAILTRHVAQGPPLYGRGLAERRPLPPRYPRPTHVYPVGRNGGRTGQLLYRLLVGYQPSLCASRSRRKTLGRVVAARQVWGTR